MASKDKGNRTIVLPISEQDYSAFMSDARVAHCLVGSYYTTYPELFPSQMASGYHFHGRTSESKKLGYRMRRVKIGDHVYQIRPSFILSYMRARSCEVKDGLFLLRFGVPFWALAVVFGRNTMFWYRCFLSFSSMSIVGTTIHRQSAMPTDLLADEFHTRTQGERTYIATTSGKGVFLGAEASESANQASLSEAYGVFQSEAREQDPEYQPNTVNTDGWMATQNTWKALFPLVQVIECFLHAFLKIRDRATNKLQDYFQTAADKVWEIYRAESKRQMSQRIRRLAEWTRKTVPQSPMKQNLFKLCKKKIRWLKHLDYKKAYRTSAHLDRMMRAMERHAINSQMFHGKEINTTSKNFRAFTILYNFTPSCPIITKQYPDLISPAARVNQFCYHNDWLINLLTAASLNGKRNQQNPV